MAVRPDTFKLEEELNRKGKPTGKYILSWTSSVTMPAGYTAPIYNERKIPAEGIEFIRNNITPSYESL